MSLILDCDYIVLMTSYHITGFCILLEKTQFANRVRKQPIAADSFIIIILSFPFFAYQPSLSSLK